MDLLKRGKTVKKQSRTERSSSAERKKEVRSHFVSLKQNYYSSAIDLIVGVMMINLALCN